MTNNFINIHSNLIQNLNYSNIYMGVYNEVI